MLAGSILEQTFIYKAEEAIEADKTLSLIDFNRQKKINTKEELITLNLNELINVSYQNNIFCDKQIAKIAHDIRRIRNSCAHDEMPKFTQQKNTFVLNLSADTQGNEKSIIKLDKTEVEELISDLEQLTPYYCISRARTVLKDLFN